MPRKEFVAFTRLDASDVNSFLMDQSVMTFADSAARDLAIPTPVEGMVTFLEDTNLTEQYANGAWKVLTPSSGNAIINGAFDIWQRGTSFTSPANGAYTADRYSAVFCSAVSRSTDTPAGFEYSAEFSAVSAAANLNYRLEASDSTQFANQTVTVSLWAKSTAGTSPLSLQTFTPNSVNGFGSLTAGPTATFTSSPTSSFVFYSVTFTVPAAATNGLQLRFIRETGTTTTRITGLKLEAGSVATPFRRNANSIQGELAACQRYFYQVSASGSSARYAYGHAYNTTNWDGLFYLPVPMRAAPSVAGVGTGDVRLSDGVTAVGVKAVVGSITMPSTTLLSDATQIVPVRYATSGLTAFRNYFLESAGNTNTSFQFNAEL
jgi:hypothetical protein